ncbi:hypothetical protein [Paraburkholderia antibiotica]|uniref:Uncharacterized protein n=1 Tax=Paraburkholderia antibiotica TaxID=2728839 RepID=A0A7X9X865_9BURK|nr:hypothetical protein [Paraburkholderia antibiotica]NML33108.1 hypothetical protein [Paraburkholderia antibiotica]
MTQTSALKPGHVSVTLYCFFAADTALPAYAARTGIRRGSQAGTRHMKRAAQKQNACISDN